MTLQPSTFLMEMVVKIQYFHPPTSVVLATQANCFFSNASVSITSHSYFQEQMHNVLSASFSSKKCLALPFPLHFLAIVSMSSAYASLMILADASFGSDTHTRLFEDPHRPRQASGWAYANQLLDFFSFVVVYKLWRIPTDLLERNT